MRPGPKNMITDVPGLLVGNAHDADLRSGTTVLMHESHSLTTSCAIHGGAPGTRETALLDPEKSVAAVDAIVLSGGSTYGVDAASGVVAGLRAQGRGLPLHHLHIPLVPAAIVFDLLNGGDKNWTDTPYPALGRAAFEAAGPDVLLGSHGAGYGALSGTLKGGLGSASYVMDDGTTVGALVVVNAVGSATTPGERHFWAAPFEVDGEFGGLGPDPVTGQGPGYVSRKLAAFAEHANTTIAIVATDATLTKSEAKRVAIAAHDGIARAVVPAHLPSDGDLVFAVSTNARPVPNDDFGPMRLGAIGHAAALCLARAIARGVFEASTVDGDIMPTWKSLNAQ
ncbi:P1 family peptidase [Chachezhania antarctica]|uniref:P1 family peptidase n=1 Tax=Chachezhania antarctica TaxID=2340860 RepID=UPI000EB56BAC|nr:P1 family peptidase [Chachezhania antarctica]|tara:strand:- start:2191 stop:3207 length:1017 start_codon:yes stop_codon:yes gene_type:complete